MASRDAEQRTYKTVAMPSTIRAGRKLGATRAERVALAMSEIINREAEDGWSYLGSDTIRTQERQGLFGGTSEAVYTILVFERSAPRRVEPTVDVRGDTVRARRAADAMATRERRRGGYGFDEELTADRSEEERRPLRRREARMAARRAEDDTRGDARGDGAPNGRGSRGLVETMRQHRDRS